MHLSRFLTLFFLLASTQVALAQDIHFTQFYNSPLQLNPALAGTMDKNFRINANETTQWSQVLRGDSYNAYNLAFDRKLILNSGDVLGFGISGYADRSGELSFGRTQGHLALAYHKSLGKDSLSRHTVSFAVELGISRRKVDIINARWVPMHNTSELEAPSTTYNPKFSHADINIGINWMSKISSSFVFSLGGAIKHINKPSFNFDDTNDQVLTQHFTIHGEAEWQVGKVTSIIPRLLFIKQSAFREITAGIELGFDLGKPTLRVGHYLRTHNEIAGGINDEAFITTFSMEFTVFRFGLSYDSPINNSLRTAGSSGGALEFKAATIF